MQVNNQFEYNFVFRECPKPVVVIFFTMLEEVTLPLSKYCQMRAIHTNKFEYIFVFIGCPRTIIVSFDHTAGAS